ncbi:MAG: hypothetical protein ACWGMZ_05795 [Thermoguttaceae bacterium]
MFPRIRLILLILGGLIVFLAVCCAGLWLALRYEPRFYREALNLEESEREKASQEFLQRVAGLISDVKQSGRWQFRITAEQINGWLAVDMLKNHPQTLPSDFHDPRVDIDSDRILFCCRYKKGLISTVLNLSVKPYVPQKNAMALRIVGVMAGLVPLPMGKLLNTISQTAKQAGWRLHWRQSSGDPVALIYTSAPNNKDNSPVKLISLRLGENELYISGDSTVKK